MKYVISILLNIFVQISKAQDFEMVILHNNDMHARFEQTKESLNGRHVGGFARTATVIKEARQDANSGKGPPVLYLNAGDTFTGTLWFSVHRWKIAATFLNALSPDVTVLGNHEFDDGIEDLSSFVRAVNFTVLTANVNFRNETILAEIVKPYTVLNVRGRKVGVIGYLTPETKLMATTGSITFEDEVVALRRECENLKREGVNIIIALGHSGYKMDQRIAKEVSDIDLVVGGHTNTFLWNGPAPDKEIPEGAYPTEVIQKNGKIVPVVQAYAYTKYMGKLHVVFDDEGTLKSFNGQPIFLDEHVPQDPDMLNILEEFRPPVDNYKLRVIGKTRTYLNGDTCRRNECNFGNALADSFVDHITGLYKGPYWSSAAIAVINGGSIRMSINASDVDQNITAGDIIGAIPFKQRLVTFDLLGKDLIKTLELGVRSNGETSRGEFLQVSGLKVVYDLSKPTGNRVVSVKARCSRCHVPAYSAIVLDDTYRVVSTNFLLNGGDGHVIIRDNSKNIVNEELYDAQSLQKYFAFYKILTPQEEERIVIVNPMIAQSRGFLVKFNYVHMFMLTIIALTC